MHRIFIILGILLLTILRVDAAAQKSLAAAGKSARHSLDNDGTWGVVTNGVTYVITPGGFKAPPGPGEGAGIVVDPFTFEIKGTPASYVMVRLNLPGTFISLDSTSSLPLTNWTYALPSNHWCEACIAPGPIEGDSINVYLDSSGVQILNIGATVSVTSDAFVGGYSSRVLLSYSSESGTPSTDTSAERTLDLVTGDDFGFAIDAEMNNLSRNRTYSLIPGPVSNPIAPLFNGRERGTIARVPIDGNAGSEVLISTVLPAFFLSDDEAFTPGLSCRFGDSSIYVEETGEYTNPLPGFKVRLGVDGHITFDIGVTLTIPPDAVPGSYTGQLIYSATYTGNAKTVPRIPNPSELEVLITAQVLDQDIPDHFSLLQNYPNPFNSSTRISYEIPKPSYVTLKIYDLLGQEVLTLVNGFRYAGRQTESLSSEALSSGIYYYRIVSENFSETKKLVVAR